MTVDMPERRLAPGEVLYGQGDGGPVAVAVFVDGSLRIELDGAFLDDVTVPGTFVGEIGALLGTVRSASVVARESSTVRLIGDPYAFFGTHPELAVELARQLAGRLHRLLTYLHDIRVQYADSDGHLSVIDSVLGRLASHAPVEIEPGSDRAPDYY
jgi:CRP-like cAMP-binding protein